MKNKKRLAARLSLLAVPALLALSVAMHSTTRAQPVPATPTMAADGDRMVAEYADRITRDVQNGKIDDLTHMAIPSGAQTAQLRDWTSEYLSQVQLQEKQRDKQYNDAVNKAQDELKKDQFDKAMADAVLAYRIAKDPDGFLKLPWVVAMTDKVSSSAAALEKSGGWLESLQLYTDLNTLYEIDTRFKADKQRLERRTRLLSVYTPKVLNDMRKKLIEKEADTTTTSPATQPSDDDEALVEASFTKWQDVVDGITIAMARRALENSEENWVENTSYDKLIKGGVESLRLFLSTPELATAFPGLADAANRKKFEDALNAQLARKQPVANDINNSIEDLIKASDDSVKLPKEVVIMEFTDGAIGQLDQFTAVIWPHEVPEFEKQMDGKFGGVGIQISLEREDVSIGDAQLKKLDPGANQSVIDKDQKAGSHYHLVVVSPLEDTPAFKAGIQAGDIITAINGKSTTGITTDEAVNTIMGDPGTTVTLKIKRPGVFEKDFPIKRAIINVASVKGVRRDAKDQTQWDYMLDPDSKIGYIRITGFQQNTPEELKAALSTLKSEGMRGLVLDLRFNPGGLLQAAVEMCDDFLDAGTIVSTKGRSPRAQAQENSWKATAATAIPPDMPMIVLVNEYSASASEIFSGAMKDLHRALIVGHRSFGKGSVQNLLSIGDGVRSSGLPVAMMKLTMQYYYLPNGENLHRRDGSKTWGVDPDVAVDLTPDQLVALLKNRRDNDIIKPADAPATPSTAPATAPSTAPAEQPAPDTQLETALLMMRLQLVQSRPQTADAH